MLKIKRKYFPIIMVFCGLFCPLVSWAGEGEAPAGVTQGVPAELVKAGAVQGLSAQDWKKMEAGEIVILKEMRKDEGKAFIQCALIFQKPIEEVHGLLTRTERQEEYLPHLDQAVLVKREGNRDTIEFLLHFSFIDIRYQVNHYYGEPGEYRMSWALNPAFKNDLAQGCRPTAHLPANRQGYRQEAGDTAQGRLSPEDHAPSGAGDPGYSSRR